MTWIANWESISARIKGLLDAGSFFYRTQTTHNKDNRSVQTKVLLPDAEKIFSELSAFFSTYGSSMPAPAKKCLSELLQEQRICDLRANISSNSADKIGDTQLALTSLSTFRSEFAYILSDTQLKARKITELAFIHLQRSIVVDKDVKHKWLEAFKHHETSCEKLGAVHLLSHGIWAFKAEAAGGATDLVLQEPISKFETEIEKSAEALVLTEWKRVQKNKDLNSKIHDAKKQANNYATGLLAGIELKNYRYLVMVSKDNLEMPSDESDGAIIYRHINIAVSPQTASISARRK